MLLNTEFYLSIILGAVHSIEMGVHRSYCTTFNKKTNLVNSFIPFAEIVIKTKDQYEVMTAWKHQTGTKGAKEVYIGTFVLCDLYSSQSYVVPPPLVVPSHNPRLASEINEDDARQIKYKNNRHCCPANMVFFA
jgi:hypothetical protein